MRDFPETDFNSSSVIHMTIDQLNWIKLNSEAVGESRGDDGTRALFNTLIKARMEATNKLIDESKTKWWPCEPK